MGYICVVPRHPSLSNGSVMNNEVVERIELKIAFLERANHELSDVVYRQQRELDALRLQLANALGRIDELKSESRPYTQQEERPPHY